MVVALAASPLSVLLYPLYVLLYFLHSCKIWNLGLEKIQKIRVIMELELDLKSIWRTWIFLPPKSSPIQIPAIKLNSKYLSMFLWVCCIFTNGRAVRLTISSNFFQVIGIGVGMDLDFQILIKMWI